MKVPNIVVEGKMLNNGQRVFIKSLNKWKRIYSPNFEMKEGDSKLYVKGYIIKMSKDNFEGEFLFFDREDLLTEEQYKFTLL